MITCTKLDFNQIAVHVISQPRIQNVIQNTKIKCEGRTQFQELSVLNTEPVFNTIFSVHLGLSLQRL